MLFKQQLTPEALERFKSKNRANYYLTVIAMSKDLTEANSQLKRRGLKLHCRNVFIDKYGQYVNTPDMNGVPKLTGYILDLL